MAKSKANYVCTSCGYQSPKWYGRCPECGNWNTLEEEALPVPQMQHASAKISVSSTGKTSKPQRISEIDDEDEVRFKTGLSELDRVLGGGIVKGSLVLIGGDPGIGKSTLLLQITQFLGDNLSVLYVSGEESARQLKLRANRLNVDTQNLMIVSDNNVEVICNTILAQKPDIVMIDSIQTMCIPSITSSPGSITQVRESTNAFLRIAKSEDIPIFIVGHVNKDGAIAGPKVLEHIVDAVLYFEGDRNLSYRILRAVKNRFGSTNEIGMFEMLDIGLSQVKNPSMMFLSGRPIGVSGSCVACVMEGTRPIMAEVQALVTKTGFGQPRRTAAGFDYNRMNLILAVLEKRAGYFFGTLDVYINVVGGLRLDEPAADLAIAAALVSSLTDKPVDENIVAFGEIGLGGEIRNVTGISDRVREASRLGFSKAIVPKHSLAAIKGIDLPIEIIPCGNLSDVFRAIK